MLVVDGNGLPGSFLLARASQHEAKLSMLTLETVRVPRRREGRPKQRPLEVVADRAYDSRPFRRWLRSRGIDPTIPACPRRERKRPKRGRPMKLGGGYSERWKVERTCLGNFRRLLVRHERYLFTFRAFLLVALILVSLRCF